ncbi:MAG: DUF4203 domain-containing protein [Phycisphaerae bacterium]|nr:DUF4203 domain-containing protein [Phycisphaerae bacterium]
MMPGIRIFLGLLVLLLGRRLYWIMVGVGGLLAGLEFAEQLLAGWTPVVRFMVAIGVGAVGALLAILAQRVAFALLGLFGGGFLSLLLSQSAASDGTQLTWFVLGGLIGAIIAVLVMDWAIVVLTSLAGAAAIVTSFSMEPVLRAVVFVILVAVGIVIQSRGLDRTSQRPDAQSESSPLREREP